ncbi:MAG: outer membrane beta-barrel protein [Candidatus Eisenbacteria bacterium]|nr:outer membrane beta-barrel protein [Candidatus Eisenbacteria bacterium]
MSRPRQVRFASVLIGLALVLWPLGSNVLAGAAPETSRGRSPQFGISVMPTLGAFVPRGGGDDRFDRELGLRVTGQIRMQPSERADILVGLAYESRAGAWSDYFGHGGQYVECGGVRGYHREVSLAYVLLPVRFRIMPMSTRVRPYLLAGAEVGYLLDARESGHNRCTGSELPSRDVRAGLKDGVAEVTVGIGLAVPVAGRASFIQLNLIEALSALEPNRFGVEGSWPHMRSRVMGLEIGTWF